MPMSGDNTKNKNAGDEDFETLKKKPQPCFRFFHLLFSCSRQICLLAENSRRETEKPRLRFEVTYEIIEYCASHISTSDQLCMLNVVFISFCVVVLHVRFSSVIHFVSFHFSSSSLLFLHFLLLLTQRARMQDNFVRSLAQSEAIKSESSSIRVKHAVILWMYRIGSDRN